LRDAELRTSFEAAEGVFVAEGRLAVEALVASEYPVRSLLLDRGKAAAHAGLLAALRERGAEVYLAERAVLAATVGFDLHRGVVALGARLPGRSVEDLLARASGRALLVVEGVNDHENLGALFRNAAAFGVGGVLLDPTCADPLYRRSVRVSLGHVLRVPFARAPHWPAELRRLVEAGWAVLALTPSAEAVPLAAVVAARGARAPAPAVVVGAEGPGLGPATLRATSLRVRIPMAEGVDSLNVATAAAVALSALDPPPGP